MIIQQIKLNQFRNYSNLEVQFDSGVNLFHGDNGQGKTNLAEAIYYICNLDSFRTHKVGHLMKDQQRPSSIQGRIEDNRVLHQLEISLTKQGRSVVLNHAPLKRTSEYISRFFCLAFTPEHVSVFRSSPQERRKFLDRIIAFIDPQYLTDLQEMSRILSQKNALLKRGDTSQISVWNELLAIVSQRIFKKRENVVAQINEPLSQIFHQITGRSDVLKLDYKPSISEVNDKQKIFEEIQKSLKRELNYGYALVGAHRDDYQLLLDGRKDREFFSQGELRVTNLSLKMSANQLISREKKVAPILIFDDLFSELDPQVSYGLLNFLKDIQNQIIITSAMIPDRLDIDVKLFQIHEGCFT